MKKREVLSLVTLGASFVCVLGGSSAVEFSTSVTIPDSFWIYAASGFAFMISSIVIDKPSRLLKHIAAAQICVRTLLYKLGVKSKMNRNCYKYGKQFHSYTDIYLNVLDDYEDNLSNDGSGMFM